MPFKFSRRKSSNHEALKAERCGRVAYVGTTVAEIIEFPLATNGTAFFEVLLLSENFPIEKVQKCCSQSYFIISYCILTLFSLDTSND